MLEEYNETYTPQYISQEEFENKADKFNKIADQYRKLKESEEFLAKGYAPGRYGIIKEKKDGKVVILPLNEAMKKLEAGETDTVHFLEVLSKEEMDKVRRGLIEKLNSINIYNAVKGTELYNILEDLGWKLSKDWNLYNEQTPVYDNPLLSFERIQEERRRFYNQFFSIPYILNKSLKRGFYSRIMARIAINYFLWLSLIHI